jgi:methionyl-tRNA formyltransferase
LKYLVAARHPWNKENFDKNFGADGRFQFVDNPTDLVEAVSSGIKYRYIFFPHWSWIVPKEILDRYECICFHMTDLPYGRGGSPLQNLISRGHTSTKLSAIRMTEVLDAGPIYYKEELSLNGRAEDIYKRASNISFSLIYKFINEEPKPIEQEGEVVTFTRKKPLESKFDLNGMEIEEAYNFIRMLDAPGYPHAFIEGEKLIAEIFNVEYNDGEIKGKIKN